MGKFTKKSFTKAGKKNPVVSSEDLAESNSTASVIKNSHKSLFDTIQNTEATLLKARKQQAPDPSIKHFLSTGCSPLDYSINHHLRNGGLPGSQITTFFGEETAGKTITALSIVAQAQAMGGLGIWFDLERRLMKAQCAMAGVDISNNWILKRPKSAEEALEDINLFLSLIEVMHEQVPLVIVMDSLAMLSSQANQAKELDENQKVAAIAGLLTRFLRDKNQNLPNKNAYLIFINQVRSKIKTETAGAAPRFQSRRRPFAGHQGKYDTPGGHCLLHMEHVRVQLERVDVFTDAEGEAYGSSVEALIVKNSLSPFLRKTWYPIFFREDQPELGISNTWACLDHLQRYRLLTQRGSWYELGAVRAQGIDNLYRAILDDAESQDVMLEMVYQHFQRWTPENIRMGLTQPVGA